MSQSKPVAKKQKATASKKITSQKSAASDKPIKLGGVPLQGRVGRS